MKVKVKKSVKVNKVNTTITPEENKTPKKVTKATEKGKSVNTPVKKEKVKKDPEDSPVKKDQKDSPKSLKYKYPEGYSQLEMKKFRMKVRKGLNDLNKKLSQVPKDSEDYKKLLQEIEDFKLEYYN